VIGTVENVPLVHVVNDNAASLYVYLVGEGEDCLVTAVQRNRLGGEELETLAESEYSVHRGGLYPGLTVVQTYKQQTTVGGAFHRLYATVEGPAVERNPAVAFARIMGDPIWGCGQAVDLDAIMAEAALLPAELRVDGVIGWDGQAHQARDYFEDVLMMRGGRPEYDPERGWRVEFDSVAPTAAAMTLQDGQGPGERTLLEVGQRVRPRLNDLISTFRLQYAYDAATETFRYTTADRSVGATGRIDTRPNVLIRDRDCADHVAHYFAERLAGAADLVRGAVVHEGGRRLAVGDIVHVICPQLQIPGADRLVVGVTKGAGRQVVNHVAWSPARYTHVAGALPPLHVPTGPSGTAAPVSPFGNISAAADAPANTVRFWEAEPGTDVFLEDTTETVITSVEVDILGGVVHVEGRAVFVNWVDAGGGGPTAVVLRVRVVGHGSPGYAEFMVPGSIAPETTETLVAQRLFSLPAGTYTVQLTGQTTSPDWEVSVLNSLQVVEYRR
jgi:hypothetical protein